MDTRDAIDFMALQYGLQYESTNSEFRAKALQWLQAAEREICSMRDWWFLEEQETFAYQNGTRQYACPDDVEKVLDLYNPDNVPLQYYEPRTFYSVFRPITAITGTPVAYTVTTRTHTTQKQNVIVFPTPDDDENGTIHYLLAPRTLVDTANDASRIPAGRRMALVYKALCLMAKDDERLQLAQMFKAMADETIAALVADDDDRKKGRY